MDDDYSQDGDSSAELFFLINSTNPNWSRIEELFLEDFPFVPDKVVSKLGIHYLQSGIQKQQANNEPVRKACLLYYKAYDFSTPPILAEELKHSLLGFAPETNMFPAPLRWSAAALLENDNESSMDSPIIHVWVYEQQGLPVEIMICGQGMEWIRKQVDTAILSATLSLSQKPTDILLEGFTRLSLSPSERESELTPDQLLNMVLTGNRNTRAEKSTPSAAMLELVQELNNLEQKTGLVKVIKRNDDLRGDFIQSVEDKKGEYLDSTDNKNTVYLWQSHAAQQNRAVAPYPLPELNLRLPLSLTESSAYRQLHDLYQNELIRMAAADALRRLNFYTAHLGDHVRSLEIYLDKNQRYLLPEKVTLEIAIDYETGLSYRLQKPEEVSRDEYYGTYVPRLIRLDIMWINKMKRLLRDLASAVGKPDSNLNRLTMVRLFDAAIRNIPLNTTAGILEAFETWKTNIQPFLWFTWQSNLEKKHLTTEQVQTRQMFFNLTIDPQAKEIILRPFILLDTQTSLFVFDPRCRIPLVQNLYDHYETRSFQSDPAEARKLYQKWQKEVEAGGTPQTISHLLLKAMALEPQIARDIVEEYQKTFMPQDKLNKLFQKTNAQIEPLFLNDLAFRLWRLNSYHSSFAALEKAIEDADKQPIDSVLRSLPDFTMSLAWLKSLNRYGKDANAIMRQLQSGYSGKNEYEQAIQKLIYRASQKDSKYVKKSVEKNDVLVSTAYRKARTLDFLDPLGQNVVNILRALAHMQSAQQFALRFESLDVKGESTRSIYAKIAPAIDGILENTYIEYVSDQTEQLLYLLLGIETNQGK